MYRWEFKSAVQVSGLDFRVFEACGIVGFGVFSGSSVQSRGLDLFFVDVMVFVVLVCI